MLSWDTRASTLRSLPNPPASATRLRRAWAQSRAGFLTLPSSQTEISPSVFEHQACACACAVAAREAGRACFLASISHQKRCQRSTSGLRPHQQSFIGRGPQNLELGVWGRYHTKACLSQITGSREKKPGCGSTSECGLPQVTIASLFSSKATCHPLPAACAWGEVAVTSVLHLCDHGLCSSYAASSLSADPLLEVGHKGMHIKLWRLYVKSARQRTFDLLLFCNRHVDSVSFCFSWL